MHTSGEWIETDPLTLRAVKTDPQGAGSAVTYGRRYSLSAALGVAWDDDDDGNEASTPPKAKPKAAKPKTPTKADNLRAVAEEAKKQHLSGDDVKEIMKRKYGKAASSELTDAEAADLAANFLQYAVEIIDDEAKMMEDVPL